MQCHCRTAIYRVRPWPSCEPASYCWGVLPAPRGPASSASAQESVLERGWEVEAALTVEEAEPVAEARPRFGADDAQTTISQALLLLAGGEGGGDYAVAWADVDNFPGRCVSMGQLQEKAARARGSAASRGKRFSGERTLLSAACWDDFGRTPFPNTVRRT